MTDTQLRCVIIGAGTSGALTACLLARRGYEVAVFDARRDLFAPAPGERPRPVLLSLRGVAALKEAGVAREALEQSVPVYGRRHHAVTGEQTISSFGTGEEALYAIGHRALRSLLLARAESHGAEVFMGVRCARVEPEGPPRVHLEDVDSGERRQVEADLVVGADGPRSTVRLWMQQAGQLGLALESREIDRWQLTIEADADGTHHFDEGSLHCWERMDTTMLALPNPDGTFTADLYARPEATGVPQAGATEEEAMRFVQLRFPDVAAHIAELPRSFADGPLESGIPVAVCDRLYEGAVALVGTAAHAALGVEGIVDNASLESAVLLDRLMGRYEGAVGRALQVYSLTRIEDARATVALADAAFERLLPGSRERGRQGMFHRLQRLIPRLFAPADALVHMGTDPLSEVQERLRDMDRWIGVGIAVALVIVGVAVLILIWLVLR